MAWLVHEGRVVASLEIAETGKTRRQGLLGREGIDGAILLRPARSVHTIRMRFAIDVAHLDDELRVLSTTEMPPGRVGRWARRAAAVLEAEAGSFRRWGVETGMEFEVRVE
ncbi:MAG: DUF192 domain-containing protein [Acidimicrobiales bacterium]|nr:DUF192 domain-containing protein [Acidimicrobiales bacterium]